MYVYENIFLYEKWEYFNYSQCLLILACKYKNCFITNNENFLGENNFNKFDAVIFKPGNQRSDEVIMFISFKKISNHIVFSL